MTNSRLQAKIQDRLDRGFSLYSATAHSLAEGTKAEAEDFAARVYGVEVRKSWTMRQIIEAVGTEIANN